MGSGLMGTLATGMAFGAGSEIAHQAVRSVIGGGSSGHSEPQQQQQAAAPQQMQPAQQQMQQPVQNPCVGFNQRLIQCLQQNRDDVAFCQSYMDMLSQCERDNAQNMNRF